jgi:hypothetical protein
VGDGVGAVHSALLVERATFDVHTPPRRVHGQRSATDRDEPDEVDAVS